LEAVQPAAGEFPQYILEATIPDAAILPGLRLSSAAATLFSGSPPVAAAGAAAAGAGAGDLAALKWAVLLHGAVDMQHFVDADRAALGADDGGALSVLAGGLSMSVTAAAALNPNPPSKAGVGTAAAAAAARMGGGAANATASDSTDGDGDGGAAVVVAVVVEIPFAASMPSIAVRGNMTLAPATVALPTAAGARASEVLCPAGSFAPAAGAVVIDNLAGMSDQEAELAGRFQCAPDKDGRVGELVANIKGAYVSPGGIFTLAAGGVNLTAFAYQDSAGIFFRGVVTGRGDGRGAEDGEEGDGGMDGGGGGGAAGGGGGGSVGRVLFDTRVGSLDLRAGVDIGGERDAFRFRLNISGSIAQCRGARDALAVDGVGEFTLGDGDAALAAGGCHTRPLLSST
jgi:hypothetical protein